MSNDIWDGDKLGRKADAQYLIEYLLAQNERARARGDRGTAVSINADWGAGKSFFLQRFSKQLISQGFAVATVDAWRDDHAEDPIFAIMAAVFAAIGKTGKKAEFKAALKKSAGKIAIKSAKGLASRAAAFVIGTEAVGGIADDIGKALAGIADETASEFADRALKQFEDGQKAIDDFRKELTASVQGDKPLFITIDELDRCRPTYAISLLERIKHLFDVSNVVFVVATNIAQLAHTTKAVYGVGFDADRYLYRFFDRIYQFGEPDLTDFVKVVWEDYGLNDFKFLVFTSSNEIDDAASIFRVMGVSLRDIKQCLDILANLARTAPPNVPVPLAYALPLIIAYHQRKEVAFKIAAGQNVSASVEQREEFGRVFTAQHIKTYPAKRDYGQDVSAKHITLNEVMNTFCTILKRGLVDPVDDKSKAGEYAERYRSAEFHALHNGTFYQGSITRTVLSQYGSLIERSGKIIVPKGPS